jgi:hypothetical protein
MDLSQESDSIANPPSNRVLEMDTPLSQSNVSLKLSLIQKRCEELLAEELSELCLEDASAPAPSDTDAYNPYDRSR